MKHRKRFTITKTGRITTWHVNNQRHYDVDPCKDLNLTQED